MIQTHRRIVDRQTILENLQVGMPLRIMEGSSQFRPTNAWDVYAGIVEANSPIGIAKAARFIVHRSMGSISHFLISTESLMSLEGDLLIYSGNTIPRPHDLSLQRYEVTPSRAIEYEALKDYNKDWKLLKQSGVLG